uniref:Apolipoprotein M n=1 Tax=Acanthochromis polyacanthus TaxID=80966 RepID=A0A3Q1G3E4_9TELE
MSKYRDMFAACAVAILCFVSASHSAPLVCEKLVHPLDELAAHHFEGRWALVAGSLNHPPSMDALRLRDSITIYFSNSTETSTYTQINRFGDKCQRLPYNISVEGSTFTFDVGNRFDLSGSFLYTSCPDCMVMRWIVKSRKRHSVDLYLLSRRREVDQKEMEEFRAQLKCYQLPAPVVMDPTEELCLEQPESQPTAAAGGGEAEETVDQK